MNYYIIPHQINVFILLDIKTVLKQVGLRRLLVYCCK